MMGFLIGSEKKSNKKIKHYKHIKKLQVNNDEKQAFKIVSKFIKKYYPFRIGKNWDKKHGNINFTLGGHALEEWIDYFADDEVDIEAFKKEMNKNE